MDRHIAKLREEQQGQNFEDTILSAFAPRKPKKAPLAIPTNTPEGDLEVAMRSPSVKEIVQALPWVGDVVESAQKDMANEEDDKIRRGGRLDLIRMTQLLAKYATSKVVPDTVTNIAVVTGGPQMIHPDFSDSKSKGTG